MRSSVASFLWTSLAATLLITGCKPTGDTNADAGISVDCSGEATHIDKVVCASNAFLATLSASDQSAVVYPFTDSVAKTRWSNLPGVTRSGLKFGNLSAQSKADALYLASLVLTPEGYADLTGVFAADDYIGGLGGGPGGGGSSVYSSSNYMIAFIGTPSKTGSWMLQIGGHHMAYNVTYVNGTGYPTPNHLGAEPKASFTINNVTYAPMADEGAAMSALFKGLDASQLSAAYLAGQTFSDVVLGPVEYGTGSYSAVSFPSGTNRKGILVSTLSAPQQALVSAAIAQWVSDFDPAVSKPLLDSYTSAASYADTYIAWGGSQSAGPDVDTMGTYFRIDGPRLWLEVACPGGIVISGKTHYHTIYRDKQGDYGKSL